MAGEKFTVSLQAQVKKFVKDMGKATMSMKLLGDMNRGIVKNFQTMSSSITGGGKRFNQTVQKMKNGMNNADKAAKKNTKTFKKLFKVFAGGTAVVGSFGLAIVSVGKALKSANIASELQVQAQAFANLTASFGTDSQLLLKQLQEASKETLDTMQIMTTASRAILLGIATDKLVDLMKIARVAAKAMGTTAAGAFSDIALGIGRQSRLILDNLGIIIRVGPAYDKYAKSIGTTANALTDFEKRQAFQTAVVEAGQDIVDRAATGMIDFQDRLAQLNVKMREASFLIGGAFLAGFETIVKFLETSGLGESLKKVFDVYLPKLVFFQVEKIIVLLEKIGPIIDKINEIGIREAAQSGYNQLITALDGYGKSFGEWLRGDGDTKNPITETMKAARAKRAAFDLAAKGSSVVEGKDHPGIDFLPMTDEDAKALGKIAQKTKTHAEVFAEAWKKILEGLKGGTATKSDAQLAREGIASLNASLQDTSMLASELQAQFGKTMPVIKKGMEDADFGVQEFTKSYEKLNKELQEKVQPKAFLESIGVLSQDRFIVEAEKNVAQAQRLIEISKNPDGVITDPDRLRKGLDKILGDEKTRAGFEQLPEKIKNQVRAINKELAMVGVDGSISDGLNRFVEQFGTLKDRISDFTFGMANKMTETMDDVFFNAITGKVTSLQDTFKNLFQSILRQLTKLMAERAMKAFINFATDGGPTSTTQGGSSGSGIGKILGFAGKAVGMVSGLFGGGANVAADAASASGIPGGLLNRAFASGSASSSGLPFSILPQERGGIMNKLIPFAKGGITSLGGMPNAATITKRPTLAAISEKGQKEAVVPLDKFADLIQPTNINITAVDTKSFAEFAKSNADILQAVVFGAKGSPTVAGLSPFSRGPM